MCKRDEGVIIEQGKKRREARRIVGVGTPHVQPLLLALIHHTGTELSIAACCVVVRSYTPQLCRAHPLTGAASVRAPVGSQLLVCGGGHRVSGEGDTHQSIVQQRRNSFTACSSPADATHLVCRGLHGRSCVLHRWCCQMLDLAIVLQMVMHE